MGVPLNVIDYRCFWKAVSAMRKFVFFNSSFSDVSFLWQYHFSFAALSVKLPFTESDCSHSKNLKSIFVKLAVQSAYMYQRQEVSCHSADKVCG